MKNRYKITWVTDDDSIPTHHHTYVEVNKQSMRSALSKFDTLFHKIVLGYSSYRVISCDFLGTVIKKCW